MVGRSALAAADPAPELAAGLTREALAALEPAERRAMLAGYLRERASAALGVPVGLDQPLTGLGLDSLSAIELKGAVESALGLSLPLCDLLQGMPVAGLAERAACRKRGNGGGAAARALAWRGISRSRRPAGALVPAPAGSRGGRLQHRRGGAHPGARRGGLRARPRRPRRPPRSAAHDLPDGRRRAGAAGAPRAGPGRPDRGHPLRPGRGSLAAVLPGARAAAAGKDLQR